MALFSSHLKGLMPGSQIMAFDLESGLDILFSEPLMMINKYFKSLQLDQINNYMKKVFNLVSILTIFGLVLGQPTYLFSEVLPHSIKDVRGVSVSANQEVISSVGQDGLARTYRHNGSAYIRVSTLSESLPIELYSTAFSSDGTLLATGYNKPRLYNCTNANCNSFRELSGSNIVTSIVISDSKYLIVIGEMNGARYSDSPFSSVINLPVTGCNSALSVALTSDSSYIVVGCLNSKVQMIRRSSGMYIRTSDSTFGSRGSFCVDVTDDAQTVIVGSGDGKLRVLTSSSGSLTLR